MVLGGLAFLNTWDFPMYVGLYAGAFVLVKVRRAGWSWARLREFVGLGVVLGILGVLLYLPFYIGFSSQAGGILPNLVYPTRGAHLWVMFGLFFIPLFGYLILLWRESGEFRSLRRGLLLAAGFGLTLFLLAFLFGAAVIYLPSLANLGLTSLGGNSLEGVRDLFLGSVGAAGLADLLLQEALVRRVVNAGGWITLTSLLGLTIGLFWPGSMRREQTEDDSAVPDVHPFVLLLILLATLLVFLPEFFYLRDQFGWRINTIFKFYYQAWLLWGIAVAFGVVWLLDIARGAARIGLQAGLIVLLGIGFIYPVLGILDKTHGFRPSQGFTLDGTRQGYYLSLDELAAIDWLRVAPRGFLVEAVGGSYSAYGRVSANTGHPTVLGWPGHESQWRGGSREMGTRERDIQNLYTTRDWDEARRILDLYDIRYVYIGPLERAAYTVNDLKFQRFMNPVFSQGPVVIYELD
jgi:YYY domain-containing protein